MKPFDYRVPADLDEALALLAEHGDEGKLLAGGTALVILMKQELVQPSCLIDLRRLTSLAGIRELDGGLAVGALATQRRMETSPLVARAFPALAETFARVANIRVRHVATVGGGLAHGDPSQDPPVTLLALGAEVRLVSAVGERTLPLDELFVDYYETAVQPTEILAEVRIPHLPPHSAAAFVKFTPRTEDDYGTVTVAVRLTADPSRTHCEDARIALGAVGSTTLRARAAENALKGQPLADAAFREAAALARTATDPIADLRGSSTYKQRMAEVFVRRALERAQKELARDGDGRVAHDAGS